MRIFFATCIKGEHDVLDILVLNHSYLGVSATVNIAIKSNTQRLNMTGGIVHA